MDKKDVINLVNKYIDILKENNFSVKSVYLFGSYAIGHYNDDSDIDVAIVVDKLTDRFEAQVEMMKLRRQIDTRIEPHPYSSENFTTDNPFVREVLSTGQRID